MSLPGSEYCFLSTFLVTCAADERVQIVTAQLGRMRASSCLTGNPSLGCVDDVTAQVREKCAGAGNPAHACSFYVGSLGAHIRNCSRDALPYLHVHHECVAGQGLFLNNVPTFSRREGATTLTHSRIFACISFGVDDKKRLNDFRLKHARFRLLLFSKHLLSLTRRIWIKRRALE